MKKVVMVLVMLAWSAQAWAWGQVDSERVRVLYPRPELTPYAERVAREAEAALDALGPLFSGVRPVVVRLEPTLDWFNAYATTFPRPTVELLAPAPASDVIDLRSRSITHLLLVHELTHTQQLSFGELPGGRRPLRLGLALERMPRLPPAWFTEGVATYMESRFTSGGRLDWAYTQGLLNTVFESDDPPDLADAGLYSYLDWPGWQTRYLLGARFVAYLVEQYGWTKVLETLRQYNAGLLPPAFSAAWRRATGTSLAQVWDDWVTVERRRAAAFAREARSYEVVAEKGGMPSLSPDGRWLAYVKEGWVEVALVEGGTPRRLARIRPQRLGWKDSRTLLYSRYVPEGKGAISDVFELDTDTGRERRVTRGLHARLAAPAPDGCFYYTRDRMGEAAAVLRHCTDGETTVWTARNGEHPLGLAVSPGGRVALAVWHRGDVDLALLEDGRLRYLAAGRLGVEPPAPLPDPCAIKATELGPCLPRGRPMHVDPAWQDEDHIVFRAGEPGVYELFRIELPTGRIERLSHSRGGFLGAAPGAYGWFAAELGPEGPRIVRLRPEPESVTLSGEGRYILLVNEAGEAPPRNAERVPAKPAPPPTRRAPPTTEKKLPLKRRAYEPLSSLKPYGWMPTNFSIATKPPYLGLELSLFGLDASEVYSYRAVVGYDPDLTGTPFGAYAHLVAGIGAGVDLAGPTAPLGFTIRAGAWPAGGEVAFGVVPGLASAGNWDRWSWSARFEAGPVWSAKAGWRVDYRGFLRAAREDRDPWGYLIGGGYGSGYVSAGRAWGVAGAAWRPEPQSPFALEARLLGGYASPVLLGGGLLENALAIEARVRYKLETAWRTMDGWMALERITLAPATHVRYEPTTNLLGFGADLGVYTDAVVFYTAPLPLGLRAGWDGDWWWRVELGAW